MDALSLVLKKPLVSLYSKVHDSVRDDKYLKGKTLLNSPHVCTVAVLFS